MPSALLAADPEPEFRHLRTSIWPPSAVSRRSGKGPLRPFDIQLAKLKAAIRACCKMAVDDGGSAFGTCHEAVMHPV